MRTAAWAPPFGPRPIRADAPDSGVPPAWVAAALERAAPPPPASEPSRVEQLLRGINPDELTPRAALELLYSLRGELLASGTTPR